MVGTMIASEVPTQSCMRTSSGTPRMRNTSYSTGTMIGAAADAEQAGENAGDDAADDDRGREQGKLADGTPSIIELRLTLRQCQAAAVCAASPAVHHQRKRIAECCGVAPGFDRLGRQMPAERARAGHAVEQAEHMAGDGMQPRAARKLALDVGDERHARRPWHRANGAASPNSCGSTASSRHGS